MAANGLDIRAPASLVRGLVVNRFVGYGIEVYGEAANGVRIAGCFLGTDASGAAARGNGFGLGIFTSPNTIVGGTIPAARNLISGNQAHGVQLGARSLNYGTAGTRLEGNLIGTDATGAAALGNGHSGVYSVTPDIVIGGDSAAAANVIAFHPGDGVAVVAGRTGNRILRNAIFANGGREGLGIDLNDDGASANDPLDGDGGANRTQNTPALHSATTVGAATTVTGRLTSTPNKAFVLRFFANPAGENEGTTFLGHQSVTTNVTGNALFTFAPDQKVPLGQAITATATGPGRNTSEFSPPEIVVPGTVG